MTMETDERYPTMKWKTDSNISRLSIYTIKIKLDSWDKKTKYKFMNDEVFPDSELRYYAKKILKEYGLKEAYISSGWEIEILSSEVKTQ